MSVQAFTKTGSQAASAPKLDATIFDVDVKNHDLLKQAYNTYLANGRENLAKTLRRGEVRGGGKKPWKQKGTGRARFGSIRVPIWRGGGITFGPLGVENYSKKLNVAAKRQAIRHALSVNKDAIIILESFENKEAKTAETKKILNKIGATRNVLLVVEQKNELIERATRNVPNLVLVQAMYLNVYDILNADHIVMTAKALEIVEQWLSKSAPRSGAQKGDA